MKISQNFFNAILELPLEETSRYANRGKKNDFQFTVTKDETTKFISIIFRFGYNQRIIGLKALI